MKTWFKGLAMAAVLAAASLGFAACSSDNDDDSTPEQETPNYSKLIVGRWQVTKEYNQDADVWHTIEDYLEEEYYLFNANGTGVYYDKYGVTPFTYILSGKMLIISDQTGKIPDYKITSISKDQLVLEWDLGGNMLTEYLERVD